MFQHKKATAIIAVIVLVSVFVYYRYASKMFQADKTPVPAQQTAIKQTATGSRELSVIKSYMATEDKQDILKFTVTVDPQGVITNVATVDPKTNETPEKKKDFNVGLLQVIKGKKLSELSQVDKIGTSTLTTNAFNSVIADLKKQL